MDERIIHSDIDQEIGKKHWDFLNRLFSIEPEGAMPITKHQVPASQRLKNAETFFRHQFKNGSKEFETQNFGQEAFDTRDPKEIQQFLKLLINYGYHFAINGEKNTINLLSIPAEHETLNSKAKQISSEMAKHLRLLSKGDPGSFFCVQDIPDRLGQAQNVINLLNFFGYAKLLNISNEKTGPVYQLNLKKINNEKRAAGKSE